MRIKKQDLPQVEKVSLKPIFGLKPGVWLTILYAFILILAIFLVGFLPDIKDPAKRITFTSEFGPQAVTIDGSYAGGTPFTKKVKSGSHKVVFSIDSVVVESFDIEVSKPVFFNWLFPRKMEVHSSAKMSEDAFKAISSSFLNDVSAYSEVLEYDNVHRYKPIFNQYIKAVKEGSDFINSSQFNSVIETALLFVTTSEMRDDANSAFKEFNIKKNAEIAPVSSALFFTPTAVENGKTFIVDNSFSIAKNEVSEAQFLEFVTSNPKWAKNNIENLIAEGLVDEYYLTDFTGSSIRPVRFVSYYAAKAYCSWLSSKTNTDAHLPTETQWIKACLASDNTYQKTLICGSKQNKILSMLGGVWEITESLYIPGDRLYKTNAQTVLDDYGTDCDIVVKGGSYINNASEINAYTVGTSPKAFCSAYTGFRVAYN